MRFPASNDTHDLKTVTGPKLKRGKFRRSDGLAVVFDNDAAWQQVLRKEERFQCARERNLQFLPVRRDHASAASQSFHTGS